MKYILTPQQHKMDMRKFKNNGLRSLFESTIADEVTDTLKEWSSVYDVDNSVLIGGLALMYYIKPRPTDDIDLIFLTYSDIPKDILGFTKPRKHAFRNIKTHVEVEVIDPESINQTRELFEEVFRTSKIINNVRVASALSVIALKLGRYKGYDISDIEDLIQHCKKEKIDLNDINRYNLSKVELDRFWKSVNNESLLEKMGYPDNMYMLECKYSRNYSKDEIIEINNADNKDFPYDIYIIKDGFEERYHFGNDFKRERNITTGFFQFEISMKNIYDMEVLNSSTSYKTFFGFEKEANDLKEWLVNNSDKLDINLKSLNEAYEYLLSKVDSDSGKRLSSIYKDLKEYIKDSTIYPKLIIEANDVKDIKLSKLGIDFITDCDVNYTKEDNNTFLTTVETVASNIDYIKTFESRLSPGNANVINLLSTPKNISESIIYI